MTNSFRYKVKPFEKLNDIDIFRHWIKEKRNNGKNYFQSFSDLPRRKEFLIGK